MAPWLGAAVPLSCLQLLFDTHTTDHRAWATTPFPLRNERLFLCENARPTSRPLPYRSDPDDDLKYFKWKRRSGIFMRGQNFNLSSLFRVAIPTNLLTVERGH